ncbi:hypothetical protein GGH94_001558 [Coemansia aciculifera]|uniref:Uncharacterized protein n=1 Tax=Coemansia aciculifera TaxID=417176 RepID=A0A9W8ISE7_9FUNG|nr:hypothetical protein GGH94_001558 [Coemansia aciculifera]KAJ2875832.1 hypothetical protein GGH93_001290 [Coemansia aciculifera]
MNAWQSPRRNDKPKAMTAPGAGGIEEGPQVTFSEIVSVVKERALKRQRRRRAAWLSVELFFLVALLALLVLHSFRLSKDTGDNTYARWSSSWVMILLSVLLVVVAMAVFVTYYYYRTVLAWIKRPETTDADLQRTQSQDVHRVGWRFLRPQPSTSRSVGLSPYQQRATRNQHLAECHQAPWVSPRGRNSRAWRQMRAHQRQRRQVTDPSSLSSTSITASSYSHHNRTPQRPPTVP